MNQQEFVKHIRSEIIDQNLLIYRDIFATTNPANVSDPYWTRALDLYFKLDDAGKAVLFQIIRQIMVDTTSNLLGVLDGVNGFHGQTEGYKLTTVTGNEKLNDGLQDLLLAMEEEEPR